MAPTLWSRTRSDGAGRDRAWSGLNLVPSVALGSCSRWQGCHGALTLAIIYRSSSATGVPYAATDGPLIPRRP